MRMVCGTCGDADCGGHGVARTTAYTTTRHVLTIPTWEAHTRQVEVFLTPMGNSVMVSIPFRGKVGVVSPTADVEEVRAALSVGTPGATGIATLLKERAS